MDFFHIVSFAAFKKFLLLDALFIAFIKGESGMSNSDYFNDLDAAKAAYGKKFQSKTANKWENRDKFVPKSGKYTLLDMADDDDDDEEEETAPAKVRPSICKQ